MWFPGTYSYSRLMVHNDTHLEWQQVMARTEEVVDSMALVQTHHGPFSEITDYPPAPFLSELDGYWAIILIAVAIVPAAYVLWRKVRGKNDTNETDSQFKNLGFYFPPVNSYQSVHLSAVV